MKQIIDFFKQWDKLCHACFGFLIMLWATAFGLFFFNYWTSIIIGTGITILCAFGKELYDKFSGGAAEWEDIFACATGWVFAVIPILVIGLRLVAL